MDKVWMKPFDGGEPKEVDATPEVLGPLMVAGWSQCEPPFTGENVNARARDETT